MMMMMATTKTKHETRDTKSVGQMMIDHRNVVYLEECYLDFTILRGLNCSYTNTCTYSVPFHDAADKAILVLSSLAMQIAVIRSFVSFVVVVVLVLVLVN